MPSVSSVRVKAGATAFSRTPRPPQSSASDAHEAVDRRLARVVRRLAPVAALPRHRRDGDEVAAASRPGAAARPWPGGRTRRRWSPAARSQASSASSVSGPLSYAAALLTTTSSRPSAPRPRRRARGPARRRTRRPEGGAPLPRVRRSRACSSRSRRRPVTATVAPAARKARAMAAPMPVPPPVTSTTVPVKSGVRCLMGCPFPSCRRGRTLAPDLSEGGPTVPPCRSPCAQPTSTLTAEQRAPERPASADLCRSRPAVWSAMVRYADEMTRSGVPADEARRRALDLFAPAARDRSD